MNYALYTVASWRESGRPLSCHETEQEAWDYALKLAKENPVHNTGVFGTESTVRSNFRVVQDSEVPEMFKVRA